MVRPVVLKGTCQINELEPYPTRDMLYFATALRIENDTLAYEYAKEIIDLQLRSRCLNILAVKFVPNIK